MKTGYWKLLQILLFAGLAPLLQAQNLSPSGITASPSSLSPNDEVTIEVAVSNSAFTELNTGTATFELVFTHIKTGSQFTITKSGISNTEQVTAATAGANGLPGTPGTGKFKITANIPTATTQSGAYRASVKMTQANGFTIGAGGLYSDSDTVLTITGKPDFAITSLTYQAGINYVGGDTIPMSLTYTNRTETNGTYNVPFVPGDIHAAQFRIEIILSSNPTFGDADDFLLTFFDVGAQIDADGTNHLLSWTQLLPGNFPGSFYVLAKIDTLKQVDEAQEADLFEEGSNVWFDDEATRLALDPTNFPTIYRGSDGGDNWSDQPVSNEDGRYTVFASDSTNLVTGDTNTQRDVFIYDQQNTTIRRLSVSEQGTQGNGFSQYPYISADSTAVAFSSDATNLVLGDTNGFSDIYLVTTFTGAINRVNLATDGAQANGSSFRPSLSRDGRYVVFESSATNLVSPATSFGVTHIYRRDTQTGTTVLVSVDSSGTAGNGNSTQAKVSQDGRYVVFASDASNLVTGDANAVRDIFMRDITAGTTVRVSVNTTGGDGNGASRSPSISASGDYVAFHSLASNLVANDTNGVADVFVRTIATSATTRVSVTSAGAQAVDPSSANFQLGSFNPSISADGRYVAFASLANNLTDGDFVGQYRSSDSNGALDIFVRDRDVSGSGTFDTSGNVATTMVSRNRFGYQTLRVLGQPSTAASDIFPAISADGRWVAFPSDAEGASGLAHGATNRVSDDDNTYRDVFIHDRRTNALPNPSNNPTVTVTAPLNGSTVAIGSTVTVVGAALAPAGTVASVEFFLNGTTLGKVTTAPYTVSWTPTVAGSYTLSALVIDSFGNQGVSSTVAVTVSTTSPLTPTVSITSPTGGTVLPVNTPTSLGATASDPDGTITSVEFFANGQSLGVDSAYPYNFTWTPTATGSIAITAEATDDGGNSTKSAVVTVTVTGGGAPTATLTSPATGSSFVVGGSIPLSATASAVSPASVSGVRFLANGVPIAADTSDPFTGIWTPSTVGSYAVTAEVTDSLGNISTSAAATVTITSNSAPTVSITSPKAGAIVQEGTPVTLTANATDFDGLVGSVTFLVNGVQIAVVPRAPYTAAWTPSGSGSFSVVARAVDNSGNVTDSAPVVVTALANGAPVVNFTFPNNGASVTLGSTLELKATATDTNGAITAVQFYANGVSVGAPDTEGPFSVQWKPTSAGVFRLQVNATDNGGLISSSSIVTVAVVDPEETDTLYSGIYLSGLEQGKFIMAKQGDRGVTFLAAPDSGAASTVYFYTGGEVDANGGFTVTQGGTTVLAGTSFAAGASGTFKASAGTGTFSGVLKLGASSSYAGPNGVVYGSLVGIDDSLVMALIGADASIAVYVRSGSTADAAMGGNLGSDGSFTLATVYGGTLKGKVDPATGFLSATLSGSHLAGSVVGAASSATPAADGFLRNLSTRGRVGNGDSILVAGFVVNGAAPKNVLVRAIGPTLSTFNVAGAVADTTLKIFQGTTVIASNDDWGSAAGVANASATVGAFALPSGSADSALYLTLNPGPYTAQVAGVGGATGVGMVEIYDVDAQTAFSSEKLMNVATRGEVGAGDQILIAGVTVNGTTPKRVLIRAVGPTLSTFGVSNPVADPVLKLVRQSDGATVRENRNWESGNDAIAVADVAASVGAFALPAGSKDAVLLITLPPGAYTALVSSGTGATGVAIVEVYEVQ